MTAKTMRQNETRQIGPFTVTKKPGPIGWGTQLEFRSYYELAVDGDPVGYITMNHGWGKPYELRAISVERHNGKVTPGRVITTMGGRRYRYDGHAGQIGGFANVEYLIGQAVEERTRDADRLPTLTELQHTLEREKAQLAQREVELRTMRDRAAGADRQLIDDGVQLWSCQTTGRERATVLRLLNRLSGAFQSDARAYLQQALARIE